MPSFLAGLAVTVLLIVGAMFIYDHAYITRVADAGMPGVHVSER